MVVVEKLQATRPGWVMPPMPSLVVSSHKVQNSPGKGLAPPIAISWQNQSLKAGNTFVYLLLPSNSHNRHWEGIHFLKPQGLILLCTWLTSVCLFLNSDSPTLPNLEFYQVCRKSVFVCSWLQSWFKYSQMEPCWEFDILIYWLFHCGTIKSKLRFLMSLRAI